MNITENITEPREIDLLSVKGACYIEPYKINISFSDGKKSIVDFESFLNASRHPEIRKYLDINLFKNYSIIDGNINWNDYDLIFPLEDLYSGKI